MRLKAVTNAANGGIGVTYSNVVLAGGFDPRNSPPPISSSYKAANDLLSLNQTPLKSSSGQQRNAHTLRKAASQVLLR